MSWTIPLVKNRKAIVSAIALGSIFVGHQTTCSGKTATNNVITNNDEYISGIKIYGVGIKQDPIPGEKRGKGIQHLNSDYFMYDLGTFIEHNYEAIYEMMNYARKMSETHPGYDFRYYGNTYRLHACNH